VEGQGNGKRQPQNQPAPEKADNMENCQIGKRNFQQTTLIIEMAIEMAIDEESTRNTTANESYPILG
jgi:hypothetical protein